jgi:branched-chain amino acid transport system ATP-binding protein
VRAVLEIEGLTVAYEGVTAIRDLSLRVDTGEVVALMGANGAGKTTTLLTIAGMLRPVSGHVRYEGRSLVGQTPEEVVRHGISIAPEGRRVFSTLTVEENLRLGAAWRRDRRQAEADMRAVTRRFPILGDRLQSSAGTLSGGQQQQLAIARALMSRPRLLLLDEPSLGLAPKLVDEVLGLVRQLGDEGLTVLLVEQSVEQTLEICDRAYVLRTGELEISGTADELAAHPSVRGAYLGQEE